MMWFCQNDGCRVDAYFPDEFVGAICPACGCVSRFSVLGDTRERKVKPSDGRQVVEIPSPDGSYNLRVQAEWVPNRPAPMMSGSGAPLRWVSK